MLSTISYLIRFSQSMSVLALSAVIVTGLLISASPAVAGTFYVSPGGNDANPGTVGAPWRTIRKAAGTLVAGDTAILMDGTYTEPEITFNNSGTAALRITLQAQNKHRAILSSTSSCNPNIVHMVVMLLLMDSRWSSTQATSTARRTVRRAQGCAAGRAVLAVLCAISRRMIRPVRVAKSAVTESRPIRPILSSKTTTWGQVSRRWVAITS